MRLITLAVVAAAASGCGSSSAGPSSNTSSVVVTMSNALKVGQTEQATATATLTGGTTQSVTAGFKSDVPAVATVTDAGLVTAVAGGLANIYVISGGKQGTKNLKVVPDLEGTWQGRYVVTSCSNTGFFLDPLEFCADGFPVGSSLPITASISQAQDSTTQSFMLGAAPLNTATAVIGADGSTSISSTVIADSAIAIAVTIRLIGSTPGVVSGTVSSTWTGSGVTGAGQFEGNLVNFVRVSSRTQSASPSGTRALPRSPVEAMRLMQ